MVEPAVWSTGGTATVNGGQLTLDGARAGTDAILRPGRSMEFVATFTGQASQHVGFVADAASGAPWAIFSTMNGDGLYARSASGSEAPNTLIPIPGGFFNSPHHYRIDWNATSIVFYLDGVEVVRHFLAVAANLPLAEAISTSAAAVRSR